MKIFRKKQKFFFLALIFLLLLFRVPINPISANAIDPITSISTQYSLPYTLANPSAIVYNNRIFIFGGSGIENSNHSQILSTTVNPDGTINNWEISETPTPQALIWHSTVLNNDSVYIVGGALVPSPVIARSVDSVYMGKITQEGKITNWTALNPLPKKLHLGRTVILNNRIYYLGGETRDGEGEINAIYNDEVYVSQINNDGTVGKWSLAGKLPEPRIAFASYSFGSATSNKIVIIGGTSPTTPVSNKIMSVDVMSDGSLSTWKTLDPFPSPLHNPGFVVSNNFIFILGGYDGNKFTDSIHYSLITPGGLPSSWEISSTSLPVGNCCFPVVSYKRNLYLAGGFNPYASPMYLSSTYRILLTPTLAPKPLPPVVIIPGMGASWNYEALIHNKPGLPDTDWKIAPFVKIYDGIISSLKTAGYEEGKNLFIYSYDWRRTLTETTSNFANFISNTVLPGKPPETKVNLVGHSLGGLLARTYVQNGGQANTDNLITVGSPHKGAAKVYPLWEGADFSDYSGWQGLLMRLYLRINRRNFENDVAVVQNLVPSLQNVWPTFNFIKDGYGNIKPNSTLSWSNNLLPGLDSNLSTILPLTRTISGLIENSTAQFLKTVQPSKLDEINNRWKDGKPVGKELANGDNSVLLESSRLNGAAENISLLGLNHGQIISQVAGQNEILKMLKATSNGVDVNQPNFETAIIAAVASPATFEITDPNGVNFSSQEDLLIVDNPVNGDYQLKLTGTGNGEYRLFFGRINGADEAWEEKSGTVSPGQSSSFTFPVDLNTPSLGGKPLVSAWQRIQDLIIQVRTWGLNEEAEETIIEKLFHYQHYVMQLSNPHHKYSSKKFEGKLIKIHFDIEKFVKRLSTNRLFRNISPERTETLKQTLRLLEEDLEQERGDRFGI